MGGPKAMKASAPRSSQKAYSMASGSDGAVRGDLGQARDAGLQAERPLAHVAEAPLRGDPEGAVAGGQDVGAPR